MTLTDNKMSYQGDVILLEDSLFGVVIDQIDSNLVGIQSDHYNLEKYLGRTIKFKGDLFTANQFPSQKLVNVTEITILE